MELQGRCIGIVGYGELGKAVAQVAKSFGMKVLISKRDANDIREGRLPLHELLPQVDILSLHCPLNDQTRNLITEKEFALMKSSAILINTARGDLVNEADLLDALVNKKITAAALDVLEHEPPLVDDPLLCSGLNNLIITPHVAWASQESRQRLVDALVKNIEAYIEGESSNIVS